jgi:hypothetical protein
MRHREPGHQRRPDGSLRSRGSHGTRPTPMLEASMPKGGAPGGSSVRCLRERATGLGGPSSGARRPGTKQGLRHQDRCRTVHVWLGGLQGARGVGRPGARPLIAQRVGQRLAPGGPSRAQAQDRSVVCEPHQLQADAIIGEYPIAAFAPMDVQSWINEMHSDELAASRIRQTHVVLSQILNAAVREGRIGRNVALGIKLPKIPRREAEYR